MSVEPTTYETPDSPVVDYTQSAPPPEYESEYISAEPLDPQIARSKFDGTQVDDISTDFRTTKTKGWQISARPETRVERIARLRREIEELSSESDDNEHESLLNNLEATCTNQSYTGTKIAAGRVASQISLDSNERLSLLESRIASIEARFNASNEVNLAAQVELLRIKIVTICDEGETKDTIERLKALNSEAATVAKSPLVNRVQELHEATKGMRSLAKNAPLVLERLRSLQGIHTSAAESRTKLDTARKALEHRRTEVENWRQALRSMEDQIATGLSTFQHNADVLTSIVEPLLTRLK